MTFIEAVIAIHNHPDLELCPNEDEQRGLMPVCIYRKSGEFVGKLRWPEKLFWAEVDDEVLEALGVKDA